jgi:cellulose synthase/poly-beta-1,6-N-acetylglucosamine synthase-like glycosyltransferase
MRTPVVEMIFWMCIGAVAYNYAGYPLLLFILSVVSQAKSDLLYLIRRNSRRCLRPTDNVPRVALLMSAYNEEAVIQAKVQNNLAIDYPSDRLEFLIGLDAPTDSTTDLLSQIPSSRLRVVPFRVRRGKLAILIDLAKETSADILVFTDANTMLERHCIRHLVSHFSDPRVGAVSGEETRVVAPGTDPAAESLYWRYESALKILESRLNCSLGGNGAVLAVRRSLFHPMKQSIVEDFQIPLEIRFRGHRVVYDPEAIAIEEVAPTFSAQFARRVRIAAGNYQTLCENIGFLNPLKGLLTFCFWSHRVLRWFAPIFLLIAFVCSSVLVTRPRFAVLAMAQGVFYSMAMVGFLLKKHGKPTRMFSAALYFCSMNLAMFLGLLRYASGRQTVTWNSTARGGGPEMPWIKREEVG